MNKFKIIRFKIAIFALLSITMLLFIKPLFAVEVSLTTAEQVAVNFIIYLDETYIGDNEDYQGQNYTIENIEPLEESDKSADSDIILGYIVNLNPQGYIVISGDTIRIPIKAYSLTSNFVNLPPAYIKTLINELKIDSQVRSILSKNSKTGQAEDINQSYWNFLTQQNIVSRKSLRSYTPDTFLLTTKWDQGYPYNKFNPKVGSELTVTGCVQTAVAQVMRYHSYPASGSGVFNHTWSGKTLTAVMNRPFNWSAMPNSVDGSIPQYQQDEVAALMRDLGVLNEADFGAAETGGTSAYFHSDQFERAFGYAPISQMDSDDPNFFTTIKNEINASRPVLLMIPNHATVADGYASDASGKKIHVNFGWGGSNDDYYYLDQTIVIDQYSSYASDHTIYYNIKPCQSWECNLYTPISSGSSPIIGSYQNGSVVSAPNDITVDGSGSDTIRVENYDPDGDTVTLSATSSCSNLKADLVGNLLTITPTVTNIFCEITIKAQSYDGTAEKSFKVLVLNEMIYIGNSYDIGGEFADGTEIDQYKAYLGGNTTISGDRGYSNGQCFYTWIKDSNGNTVVEGTNLTISKSFTAGIYTIYTSLKYTYPSGGYTYYNYDADHSGYTLTITCSSLSSTVSDLAASMGIELSDDSTPSVVKPTVETNSVNSITTTSVTLNGTINPNSASTSYYFEYGTSTGYGKKTATQSAGSGNSVVSVTANITGLSPNTDYHFRLVAANSAGTTNSSDQTFKTLIDTIALPNSVTSYKILTNQSNSLTVQSGEYPKVFGASIGSSISIKSGGRVECVNFVGSNIITIEDNLSDFTVYRSGATVYLESSNKGTKIKIPATKTAQLLKFNNGSSTLSLVINSGKVMLGTQEIGLKAAYY